MGKKAWTVLAALGIVCMLVVVGTSTFMGGCAKTIETAMGGEVPMKCHWTFIATTFVGIIGIVTTLLSLVASTREARRTAALATAVTAIVILLLPSPLGIGLCGDTSMHCHQTALYVWIAAGASLLIAVIQIARADPAIAELPKKKL